MKETNRSLLPKWLIITSVALILAVAASFTIGFAAYTSSRYAQRTIAPYDDLSGGYRFSSTVLGTGDSEKNVKFFYTTSEAGVIASVPINNHPSNKQHQPNENDIIYTLSARFVKQLETGDAGYSDETIKYGPVDAAYVSSVSAGDKVYTVAITKRGDTPEHKTLGGDTVSLSFNGTLPGGSVSFDTYYAQFSPDFTNGETRPNLYLEMIATPAAGSDLPTLSGIIKPEKRVAGATNAWAGEFTDATGAGKNPADYDGFNYRVSGMGSGTCTLRWNGSIVALSLISQMELMAIDGATKEGNAITFPVDSDEISRYDLQFYKVNVTNDTSWEYMNGTAVTLSFVSASA